MTDFITPPNHVNFKAKKLFADLGEIIDGQIVMIGISVKPKL